MNQLVPAYIFLCINWSPLSTSSPLTTHFHPHKESYCHLSVPLFQP